MRTWVQLCSVITIFAACVALLQLVDAMAAAKSAPQQAEGAAMACAIAIIPYVFTRAFDIWQRCNELDLIRELLAAKSESSPPAQSQLITPAELLAGAQAMTKVAQAERARSDM